MRDPSQSSVRLNEAGVIILGDVGVGKTSIVKGLLNDQFEPQESAAHWIHMIDWGFTYEEASLKVRFWDFSGDGIYSEIHRLFLTTQCLYLVVIDATSHSDIEIGSGLYKSMWVVHPRLLFSIKWI